LGRTHRAVYELSAIGLLPFLAALERFAAIDRLRLLAAMNTVPKATSSWRLSMLIGFKLEGLALDRLQQPVLAIASGADRLLPSVADARYLLSKIPQGKLVVLPDSGHACLLERDVNLYQIMKSQQFLEPTLV
jgi:pimeloyl-ACP methyl ester carboxylesterase